MPNVRSVVVTGSLFGFLLAGFLVLGGCGDSSGTAGNTQAEIEADKKSKDAMEANVREQKALKGQRK